MYHGVLGVAWHCRLMNLPTHLEAVIYVLLRLWTETSLHGGKQPFSVTRYKKTLDMLLNTLQCRVSFE